MKMLYENIKKRRNELQLTQAQLAALTGYADKSMIAKVEKGLVDLPQSKIDAFAKALLVTPIELTGAASFQSASDQLSHERRWNMGARVKGGYQPTQPKPERELELNIDYRSAHIIAIRVEKIRKEALRLIGETAVNCTGDHALEAINYIAGVVDLAAALIEREKEDDE